MHGKFKMVIARGNYELADLKSRIALAWAGGEITTEQRAELDALAEQSAKPENSYASAETRIEQAFGRIADLEARVLKLEGGTTDGEGEEYPAWVQPTGAHDAYRAGGKMTYTDGKRYICVAPENVAVVWGPDVMPGYWQGVE